MLESKYAILVANRQYKSHSTPNMLDIHEICVFSLAVPKMTGNQSKELEVHARKTPELPREVWGVIFKGLTRKEQACASGTCRAAAGARRFLISVPKDLNDLHWLCSRWAGRDTLALSLQAVGPGKIEVVYALGRNLQELPFVRQLALSCCPSEDVDLPYLRDMLACMPNLHMLSLKTACVPPLPCFKYMIHLCLTAMTKPSDDFYRSLTALERLETLSITVTRCQEAHILDSWLGEYQSLRSVNLVDIIPLQVDLPALQTFSLEADLDSLLPEWDTIRHNGCSMLRIRNHAPTNCLHMINQLTDLFPTLTRLDIVMVHCDDLEAASSVGTADHALVIGASLPSLQVLTVDATNIYVEFEEGPQLQEVTCTALGICFAIARDVAAFMADIKYLRFSWQDTPCCPWFISELCDRFGLSLPVFGRCEWQYPTFGEQRVHRSQRHECCACDICLEDKSFVTQSCLEYKH